MRNLQHHEDFGRRVLAEWIQLQQHVAQLPIPPEPSKDRTMVRDLAAGFCLLLVITLCGIFVLPTVVH